MLLIDYNTNSSEDYLLVSFPSSNQSLYQGNSSITPTSEDLMLSEGLVGAFFQPAILIPGIYKYVGWLAGCEVMSQREESLSCKFYSRSNCDYQNPQRLVNCRRKRRSKYRGRKSNLIELHICENRLYDCAARLRYNEARAVLLPLYGKN